MMPNANRLDIPAPSVYAEITIVDKCCQEQSEAAFLLPEERMGRPRDTDVERYDNGRKKADWGTPEQQQKRVEMLEIPGAARDERASTAAGIAQARGLIFRADLDGCERYAALYLRVEQPRAVKSHLKRMVYGMGGDVPDIRDRDREQWEDCSLALGRLPRRGSALYANIVLHDNFPRFLDFQSARGLDAWRADMRDLDRFRAACDAVVTALRIARHDGDDPNKRPALEDSVERFIKAKHARIQAELLAPAWDAARRLRKR